MTRRGSSMFTEVFIPMKLSQNVIIYIFLCLVLVIAVPLIKSLFFNPPLPAVPNSKIQSHEGPPPPPNSERPLPPPPVSKKDSFRYTKATITTNTLQGYTAARLVLKAHADLSLKKMYREGIEHFELILINATELPLAKQGVEYLLFEAAKTKFPTISFSNLTRIQYLSPLGICKFEFEDKLIDKAIERHSLFFYPNGAIGEPHDCQFHYNDKKLSYTWNLDKDWSYTIIRLQ